MSLHVNQVVLVGSTQVGVPPFFPITDTNVHTYRTDPNYIRLVALGNTRPPIRAFAVKVLNNENQSLTVSFLANDVNDQSFPDATLLLQNGSSSATVAAGSVGWFNFNFDDYFVPFFSISLQYSTAPTAAALPSFPFGVYARLIVKVD